MFFSRHNPIKFCLTFGVHIMERGEHGVNRGYYYDFAVFIIREREYEIKFVYLVCCFRTTDI